MSTVKQSRRTRDLLAYLASLPDGDVDRFAVLDFYDLHRPVGDGIVRLSQGGSAGRIYWRLCDAGLIDADSGTLTALGKEASAS